MRRDGQTEQQPHDRGRGAAGPGQHQGGHEQQIQCVDLGHDRLTPNQRQEGEGQGDDGRRQRANALAPLRPNGRRQQPGGPGGAHGREQVIAERGRAQWQQAEQLAQRDVGRVAGRVGHAEGERGGDEFAAVAGRAGPRQVAGDGREVDGQGDGGRHRGQRPHSGRRGR